MTRADYIIGVHPNCGGLVEIVEYAAVCMACEAQDWNEHCGGAYQEDLMDVTVSLHELPCHDPGDEDRS